MTAAELLREINKTNPEMTMEKMMEELRKSRYAAACLAIVSEN